MSDYLYRVRYPVEDQDLTTRAALLVAERNFCDDALDAGISIVGKPTVRLVGERVYVEAPAVPPGCAPARVRHELTIADLAEHGLCDAVIAERLALSVRTVGDIRREAGVPAGRKKAA